MIAILQLCETRRTRSSLSEFHWQATNFEEKSLHTSYLERQDQQQDAMLCFEHDNGALHLVTTKEVMQRVCGTLFLVTLNACVSATSSPTLFHNLAALVRQKTPYALGMRFSILDEDVRTFSLVKQYIEMLFVA